MSDKLNLPSLTIVLFEPKIPQNAGNLVRCCKVAGASLILVRPLGFSTSSSALKRAGLDYWDGVSVEIIDNLYDFLQSTNRPFYFFSSHASKLYTEATFEENSLLIFGSETSGLPSHLHETYPTSFFTIPMVPNSRCLNLSNAASIVLYEAWRQLDFRGR